MFADNEVVIPFDVIEELDKFKAGSDDLGRNARDGDPAPGSAAARASCPMACRWSGPAGGCAW